MAMKKWKASSRAKKKPAVKDLTAKSGSHVKGGGGVVVEYKPQKDD